MLKTTALKIEILKSEKILQYVLIVGAVFIPLLISKPQLLVGSAVNAVLILYTLKYGFKKSLPLYFIPSIVSLSKGLLFGGFTPFLLYLIPFIIISNIILGYLISRRNNILSTISGVLLKVAFLFLATYSLVQLTNLPNVFLSSMGYIQLITGIVGAIIALSLNKVTQS